MTERMSEQKKEDNFLLSLVEFHKSFLDSTIDSIKQLLDIQGRFPKEYKDLVKLQKDPSYLLKVSERMGDEERKILIDLFIRASALAKKLSLLYELTVSEKEELVKEIGLFSKSMDKNIYLLGKKKK